MSSKTKPKNSPVAQVVDQIRIINPTSKADFVTQVEKILQDTVVEVINSHNTPSVIFVFELDKQKYVIKAELGKSENSIAKEIKWYSKVGKNLSYVPKFISSVSDEKFCAVVIKYIENSSTLDNVAKTLQISPEIISGLIETSLERLNCLFHSRSTKLVSKKQSNQLLLDKYNVRKQRAIQYPFLKKLFRAEKIVVNGEELPTFDFCISHIQTDPDIRNYLTPKKFGVLHGDLHCGNILVDNDFNTFWVDPNGNLSLPVEYDYGKILHSIHGGYGLIMSNDYQLTKIGQDKYEFSINVPDGYSYSLRQLYKGMNEGLLIRSLYMEALHFATMLPHHASNEKETTALCLRGIQLFKELFLSLNEKQL